MQRVRTANDVAELVRAARSARGWSQQRAAHAAGVSRRFVNMVEGGHPTAEVGLVLTLLASLGVSLTGALHTESPATPDAGSERADLPGEIDLDAYLSTFRTPARFE